MPRPSGRQCVSSAATRTAGPLSSDGGRGVATVVGKGLTMFGTILSHGLAIAFVSLTFSHSGPVPASPSVAKATAERSVSPLPPIYREINYRILVLDDVPNQCFDLEVSTDNGNTWELLDTVCHPI